MKSVLLAKVYRVQHIPTYTERLIRLRRVFELLTNVCGMTNDVSASLVLEVPG
jgi:hypothetical protein